MPESHCVLAKEGEYNVPLGQQLGSRNLPLLPLLLLNKRQTIRAGTSEISASLYPNRLVSLRLEPQSQLVLIHGYSQNRFSNSLNSLGLISSLLIPSISINTPWRA